MRNIYTGILILLFLGFSCITSAQTQKDTGGTGSDNPTLDRAQRQLEKGKTFGEEGLLDSAMYYLDEAYELFRTQGYNRGMATTLEEKIDLHYTAFRIPEMRQTANRAYDLYLSFQDTAKASAMAKQIGLAIELQGEYVEALRQYLHAYDLANACRDTLAMANALSNMGLVYQSIDDPVSARSYLSQALKLGKMAGDERAIIGFELNLGNTFDEKNELDSGLYFYQSVFERARTNEDLSGYQQAALCNISNIHLIKEDYATALDYIQQASAVNEEVDPTWNIIILITTSEAYFGLGEYDKSYQYLSQACDQSEAINYLEGLITCREYMARHYKQVGDYQQAYHFLEEYQGLRDSIRGAEINQELQVIKAQDELANLNQEIANLEEQQMEQEAVYKRKRNTILLIGGVLILLLASLFLYHRSRTRVQLALDEKHLAESKLDVLRSQMNPQFIYNAYGNTLSFFLNSGKREMYDYLSKFGALLRSFIGASSQTYIALDREVNFLQNYLALEQLRSTNELVYHIEVAPDLMEQNPSIPSMMIHPFVENAVRNRREIKEPQGELLIEFKQDQEGVLCCLIKDYVEQPILVNAEGEEESSEPVFHGAFHNGQERLSFLRKIGYEAAKIEMDELSIESGRGGTQISLFLPSIKT